MWLILQHETPEDFVIATDEMHSVREFCELAFRETGISLRWEGIDADAPLPELAAKLDPFGIHALG